MSCHEKSVYLQSTWFLQTFYYIYKPNVFILISVNHKAIKKTEKKYI